MHKRSSQMYFTTSLTHDIFFNYFRTNGGFSFGALCTLYILQIGSVRLSHWTPYIFITNSVFFGSFLSFGSIHFFFPQGGCTVTSLIVMLSHLTYRSPHFLPHILSFLVRSGLVEAFFFPAKISLILHISSSIFHCTIKFLSPLSGKALHSF